MNLILERTDQVPFFTNMRLVLNAMNVSTRDYDWYLSDLETNYYGSDFTGEDQWLSGEALQHLLQQHEIQFIWAVFSAVPKGFRCEVENAPYIEGNSDYWSGKETKPQLGGALFEIACWDSSATILVGVPLKAVASFTRAYPDVRPLISAAR